MRVVELTTPAADAEVAADRLWSSGASAIEELASGDRTVFRTVLAADDAVSRERVGELPATWTLRFVDVDEAVSEAWREFVAPIEVGADLVLRPAWLAGGSDEFRGRTVVDIEPAGSFGLGDHPTTRLSAGTVWRLVGGGERILDVGCGSGVLSIVALRRGAEHAVAIDVAEAAREATVANAMRNGVEDRIDASCTPLADVDGRFDLIVANILAPTLVALARDLKRLLAPGGRLIISGVLAAHHDHVLDALAPLRPARTDELDAWACVELDDQAAVA